MINATLEQLPIQAETDLRQWLRRPQIETLRRVIAAKQKEAACLALRDAAQASGSNYKLEAANVHLAQAQRYQTFLDVLKEVEDRSPAEPFTFVKLT